jgi:hypothetical protein
VVEVDVQLVVMFEKDVDVLGVSHFLAYPYAVEQ